MPELSILPDKLSLSDWFTTQPDALKKIIAESPHLHNTPGDEYSFDVKKSVKKVYPNFLLALPAGQTIAAHPKNINAYFSPLFKKYVINIIKYLKSNFKLFTRIDLEELNVLLFPDLLDMIHLELDIAKFDKSQELLASLVEYKLMIIFGFSRFDADLWFSMRHYSVFRSVVTGVSFAVLFQMKSGVSSTFISNTMHQMSCVFDQWTPLNNDFAVFCGDDSLIFSNEKIVLDLSLFAVLYNMEIKQVVKKYPYFAGKFFIRDYYRSYVIPDPIKILFSLCRQDVPNKSMLSELKNSYYSLFDFSSLSYDVILQLSDAINERYLTDVDYVYFIKMLPDLINNLDSFFFVEHGAIIDESAILRID